MKSTSLAPKSGQPPFAGINPTTACASSGLGCGRRSGSRQCLEFFARLETYGLAGRNANLLPGARVAADPGLPRLYVEHAEAPKFNAFPSAQRVLHGLEDSFHRLLGLGAGHVGFRNYGVNDIKLDHAILQLDRAIPRAGSHDPTASTGNLC